MTTQQINGTTTLGSLAEMTVTTEWWKEGADAQPNALALPTRVLKALENDGIHTVEQLKAAGPARLHKIDHIGKLGFEQIVALLRALDRQTNGGGSHDQQHGQTTLR